MLKNSKAFSSFSAPDIEAMQRFYGETLGVEVVEEDMGGLELRLAGGASLFIYPSTEHQPPGYTELNFAVDDIEITIDELAAKGVSMEQYPDFGTDQKGISRTPEGQPGPKAIAWFKDPAGHILAIIQEK